jgi:DtxR family Mn-dependent transcriptional regulator
VTAPSGLSAADYLEALYEMIEESIPPVQARLAEWMGVSRASVSEAVRRLRRDGYLRASGRRLELTPKGQAAAEQLVRRHRLAELMLIDMLGVPWHLAHQEATVWGRAISDEVEARIVEALGDPGACPHGNPVPGSAKRVDVSDLRPLHEFGPGDRVDLGRLTEDLELELEVMRFLEDSGLLPGARIAIESVAPDGTMTLKVGRRSSALGAHLADNLWVRPAAS